VADALRALKPDLRVLFMSGYMADEQVRSTLAIEGSHFLCKPFEVTGLTDAVRQALDARRVS
jgi:DNA-binding NarL/FixJ family response regulator